MNKIKITGAREHNLKNIDLEIPRDKLVVITGISGSGKSSLAFDTIYAEGERRYVESLSSYARQFLGMLEKPDVDKIEGLSPAISIDQKSASHNPRSTVGTVTEIYDYLRLLFARVGHPHCPNCHGEISAQTPQQIVAKILSNYKGKKIIIFAPIIKDKKGEHKHVLAEIKKAGYVRVRIDNRIYDMVEASGITLDRYKKHTLEVVVDRLEINQDLDQKRLVNSVELALDLGEGIILVQDTKSQKEQAYNQNFSCPTCEFSLPEIQPRLFSFNSPHGACLGCQGLGIKLEVDPDLVIPNKKLTLAEGAIRPWARSNSSANWYLRMLEAVSQDYGFSLDVPVEELDRDALNLVLYGTGNNLYLLKSKGLNKVREYATTFEGVIPNLTRRFLETESDFVRSEIEKYMVEKKCETCEGQRLKPEVLAITVGGKNIIEVTKLSISEIAQFMTQLPKKSLNETEKIIARQIIKEIQERLKFLVDVGLSYLTLDRSASTLAGGEAQRIRLATQIGSGLTGVLYILDEPSIGLHQRDHLRLLKTLKNLRDLGNSVIVVEHDRETMLQADWIIDIGPGAGDHGGRLVAAGTPQKILKSRKSITGQYLAGKLKIPTPTARRKSNGKFLQIKGAQEFNLKNIDVRFPLALFICVTGVSGSGKSTLINEILAKALIKKYHRAKNEPGKHKAILGSEHLDKVVNIDQSPIGRTPRSNPATYTGIFTGIRELFAATPEAKMRGYKMGRFSFNVRGGRCEACRGEGQIKIEMHFLPDVYVACSECRGARYNKEALEIHYHGKNISEVLEMTVEEAHKFFANIPSLKAKLEILERVGLGYIKLGQPATTLSGGEAQRVKLATELARKSTGRTLYILDEPTTGLHFEDTKRLLHVLDGLVDRGNTVLVIEHNLDVIKSADWIIDLGPEGGDEGGRVIAQGTPEKIAQSKRSYTGKYLKEALKR